jgi:peroxiredoxin
MMRRPPNWQELSVEKQSALTAAWEKTPEARLYNQERCPIDFRLSSDGDFTVPDLPAGDYRMTIASWSGAPVTSRMLSRGTVEIHIPEMPSGRSDEPLDLGEVLAYSTAPLRTGDRAPYFESVTLEGRNIKLSDFAGKNVLVHFWRTDMPESLEALGHLKAAREKWGKDKRLVLIGMNFDDTPVTAAMSVSTHALSWPQCFVGKQSDMVNKYRLRQPTVLLIGEDGRILQPQLAGDEIATTLEALLK